MAVRLGVVRAQHQGTRVLAAQSRLALDRPLRCPAELWVAVASDEAVVLGAFQRGAAGLPRRGSGGPEVRVAPGTVHVLLALATPAALVPCDEKRIVNRYVRPLLRALTKTGHLAHYFGRDWVSGVSGVGGVSATSERSPVAWVGFAHDASTRRTAFEAFVAVHAPFAVSPRPSFLGKEPAALDPSDSTLPGSLVDAIVLAYGRDVESVALELELPPAEDQAPEHRHDEGRPVDPPWAATREEAIGTLGAGPDARGVFRIGGDLLVSRDALAHLEAAVTAPGADVGALVDATLAAPGVALDGVRSLASVRDVITEALRATRGPDASS